MTSPLNVDAPIDWSASSVLITGGTGSFGRKFVQVMLERHHPRRLAVLSRDELKQSDMRQQFPEGPDSPMRFFLGDVRDRDRLRRAFSGVDIVVHAAALKQVPAAESDPFEAVQTNIMGTRNVIEAAIDTGVNRVLTLSTDKAVNPVNLYGATKLVAEKLTIQANTYSMAQGCRMACSRYGNVVGSRGSVVPLFQQQRETGRVTITDPAMTRFWITLEQGVEFVIKCIERMRGGEVFVPKMPSVRVTDIADLIAPRVEHEYIGIRPGEKLHEVLVGPDESRTALEFEDHYLIQPAFPFWEGRNWGKRVGGTQVGDRFTYTSDENSWTLSPEELRKMIDGEM